MAFVESGDQPRFSDETLALLRDRLRAASFIISLVFAFSFILNLFGHFPFLAVRALFLAVVIGCAVLLHRAERPQCEGFASSSWRSLEPPS